MKNFKFFMFVLMCLNVGLSYAHGNGAAFLNKKEPKEGITSERVSEWPPPCKCHNEMNCPDEGKTEIILPKMVLPEDFTVTPNNEPGSHFVISSKKNETDLMISQNSLDGFIIITGKSFGYSIGNNKALMLPIGKGTQIGDLFIYAMDRVQYEQSTENFQEFKPYPEQYDHVINMSVKLPGKGVMLNILIRNKTERTFEIVDLKLFKN